jgi:hypothetical protein
MLDPLGQELYVGSKLIKQTSCKILSLNNSNDGLIAVSIMAIVGNEKVSAFAEWEKDGANNKIATNSLRIIIAI